MSEFQHTAPSFKKSHAKKKIWWVFVLGFCVVLIAEGVALWKRAPLWPISIFWKTEEMQEIVVREGMGGTAIAYELFDKHVINNASSFLEELTKEGADFRIKMGTYEFNGSNSVSDIVTQLTVGPNSDKGKLTIPEGKTVKETAAIVEKIFGISVDTFMEEAKASNFSDEYAFLQNVEDNSLEGFLYGSTYDFSGEEPSAADIIDAMLSQYQKMTESLDFKTAAEHIKTTYGVDMTEYDFVKLASIVQKEGKVESDYPQIASVFYNRLQVDMYLQSDATLAYQLGRSVTAEDLAQENLYNSYLVKGLPPTPICSPTFACLQAALEPVKSDNYYFFIYDKGTYSNHTFSKTYDEHQKAIEDANKNGDASFEVF